MNEEDPLILFLYNVEDKTPYGNPLDLIALQDTAHAATQLIRALRQRGYRLHPIEVRRSLTDLRHVLKSFPPDNNFIFNYCDSFRGKNMAAAKIVHLIESLGYKHTGSSTETVITCIDKSLAKKRLIDNGVPTPRYQVFVETQGKLDLTFPVIVKPMTDDGSIGISLKSVVSDKDAFLKQIATIIRKYQQPALVEEFIGGRELAVSAWGNEPIEILPIAEHDYSHIKDPLNHLLTYESKWVEDDYLYKNIHTITPAPLTPKETEHIQEVMIAAVSALGMRDYCRADIRYHNGIPYIIDVNEIPDLAPGSGFSNSAIAAGYSFEDMAEHILQLALQREKWQTHQLISK